MLLKAISITIDRFDVANVAVIFDGVLEKEFCELRDFHVGHARIRLSDIHKAPGPFAGIRVAHRECVIRQQAPPFPWPYSARVTTTSSVASGRFSLIQYWPAAPRHIRRLRPFRDKAFVAFRERRGKAASISSTVGAKFRARELQFRLLMRRQQIRHPQAPLREFEIKERFAIQQKQIESDKAHGHKRRSKQVDLFTTQALLQFGERDCAPIAPADDFAIEDEIAGNFAKRSCQLWKFGDAIQRARIHLYFVAALVNLSANAVEFFFDERTGGKHFDEFRRRIDRTREHH